jgi:DNA (cytosine-5)-methyltransferase 1
MATKPTAIDLFSGCGGVSLGLAQAGFAVIGAVELDKWAVTNYGRNHRDVDVWNADIRSLSATEVRSRLALQPGQLDVLTACAPCQGFSRLTTRNGAQEGLDARNDLVLNTIDFVEAFRPRAVMLENVPQAQVSDQMRRVRGELSRLGYRIEERVVDVSRFGVPQRRRRYILIAALNAEPRFASEASPRVTVRDTIGHLETPGSSDDELHDVVENRSMKVGELIAAIPRDGGSRSALGQARQLPCHLRMDGFKDVYGRMAWDKPAPTITSGFVNPSKGRFLHPEQNRAITPREGALLQGFPANYQISIARGKFAAASLIGNAVPPPFVKRQAEALLASVI